MNSITNGLEMRKTGEWTSWPDFLGYTPHRWTRTTLLEFIKSLRGTTLETFTETELLMLMAHNGSLPAFTRAFGRRGPLGVIQDLKENEGRGIEAAINKAGEAPDEEVAAEDESGDIEIAEDVQEVLEHDAQRPPESLPSILAEGGLHDVDVLNEKISGGLDEELAEFYVTNRVAGLWDAYVKGHSVEERLAGKGGHYFNTIRDRFEYQRSAVESLEVPKEWSFKKNGTPEITPPFPMQKRTAWEVLTRKRVGNWSEPGTGKTNSAQLAIRVTGSRNALVIAANSTVEGWAKAIMNTFPDTEIHTTPTEPVSGRYNITLLNYEKFQQSNSVDLVWRLHKLSYDFVVLDEVQFVKQRQRQRHKDDGNKSLRRFWVETLIHALAKDNPNLYVLGMSATPVINNLFEARKLLEIVTGRSFGDLDTKATILNAIAAHRNLMVYGFRYHANFDMRVHPIEVETVRNDLIEDLRGRGILETEQILLDAKLEALYEKDHFRKGTLVYIEYVDGIDHRTRRFLEERGFSVGMCTGKDKSGLQPFRDGKLDILIGSRTVATGVDGLQNVCDNVILLSPPWTGADEKQIEGRVVREGSDYDHVTMVWPQVVVDLGVAGSWSWDKQRREIIEFKQTLSDCAVDGRPPKALLPSKHSLLYRAREALEDLIARLEGDGYEPSERPALEVPLPPKLKERAQVKHGDFRKISRRWATSNSATTHERLKADKSEWYLYHTLYEEARTHWDEIPAEYIASQLKARPDLKIADFGCGTNLLKAALPEHDVVGLDHVVRAGDNSTIECDIANTPLETASKDAVVLSLALMGCNWPDYLKEAHRLLKPFGYLFVAEPAKKRADLAGAVGEHGFDVIRSEQRGDFRYVRAVKAD